MTMTVERVAAPLNGAGTPAGPEGGLLPSPPKARRRWGLFAAMAALVCLVTVQVGSDPALRSVPASALADLVGKRAAVDVAAGSLLTTDSTTDKQIPGTGHSLVGVGVMPAMMPGTKLMAGDRVRIVATPSQAGVPAATPGAPTSVAAVVVSTFTGTDTTGQGAQTIITVDVPSGDAAQLAAMAASGKVAVVLDSRDR